MDGRTYMSELPHTRAVRQTARDHIPDVPLHQTTWHSRKARILTALNLGVRYSTINFYT